MKHFGHELINEDCEACGCYGPICKCDRCEVWFCVSCWDDCKGRKDDPEENAKLWEELDKFNK